MFVAVVLVHDPLIYLRYSRLMRESVLEASEATEVILCVVLRGDPEAFEESPFPGIRVAPR
jgi:hypothetical protein